MMDRLLPLWDFLQELFAELREVLSLTPEQTRWTPQQRQRILKRMMLMVFALLLEVTVAASAYSVYHQPAPEPEEEPVPVDAAPEPESEPEPDITATLALVGDVLPHMPVTNAAKTGSGYDYTVFFNSVADWISGADYAIANLEAPISGGAPSGNPLFNAPESLAQDLRDLGFDLVTTANNHCIDQSFSGLSHTLDVLDEVELAHVGTYRSQTEYDESMGVETATVNGISIAFLDYTYGVNYNTLQQDFSVNRFTVTEGTPENFDTEKLDAEMEYARFLNTDLIIVCLHWGYEYQTTQAQYQEDLADYLIARGADAVLGGHAHVPQPLEYRTVTDINGNQATGFVCYSLGNFISNQSDQYTDTTAILNLKLEKSGATGESKVAGVTYVPTLVLNRGTGSTPRYLVLDVEAAIASYNSGSAPDYIDSTVYERLTTAESDLKQIFGSQWAYSGK